MQATFDVALSREQYREALDCLVAGLRQRDSQRDRHLWEQLGSTVLLIIVLTYVFRDCGAAVVVTIIAQGLVSTALSARLRRHSSGVSYDPDTAAYQVELSDGGVIQRDSRRLREWRWSAVRRIHDRPVGLVLEFVGWDMVVVPSSSWATMEEKESLVAQVAALAPSAALVRSGALAEGRPGDDNLLKLGALAVGLDLFFLASFIPQWLHQHDRFNASLAVLGGAVLGFAGYIFAARALPRLYRRHRAFAIWLAQLLCAAVPLYILAASIGWL
jgi:hypothetical protein